ncbi:MAG: hypothetical protein ACOVQ7_13010 [Limnoraphis robusta]|jgi:hypothetical protein
MSNQELLLDSIKTIGEYDLDQDSELEKLASKLKEIEDTEFPDSTSQERGLTKDVDGILKFLGWVQQQPWNHANHTIGYIAPSQLGAMEPSSIQHASSIQADPTLKNSRIDIHLDLLRIFNYPGSGTHNIMVTFAAQNQLSNASEAVTFSQTYRVPEGETAPVKGWPIFIGLNVGNRGVAFEFSTINVKNEGDEGVLKALESPAFKIGLNLLQTAQPAIAPFTDMTLGVVKAIAERTQNVPVQKFYLGLDFNETAPLGLRLREGNYIAVQVPDQTTIKWDGRWIYDPKLGTIVHKADSSPLEYNYLVFRVSRYTD